MAQKMIEVKGEVFQTLQTTSGINIKSIPKIQKYIQDYKNAIDAKKITKASKNAVSAIKGSTQEAAVKSLCQACDAHANSLTTTLSKYISRLNDVKAAYQKNDQTSTSISSVTSSLKGTGNSVSNSVDPKTLTPNKS